jgi:putative FmdB family regulatory protein
VPLYEYRCTDCDHRFDALVPAGRADQTACPSCGAEPARRLLSVFSAPRAGAGPVRGGDGAAAAPSGGCCGGACGAC